MDVTVKAIDLAKAAEIKSSGVQSVIAAEGYRRLSPDYRARSVALNKAVLEERRIVSHNPSVASRSFDMLRTHVLKEMDRNGWRFLAITSPTAGCGNSTIACNLAMSMSRLTDRAPVLVDMNLKRPSVAGYLGISSNLGVIDVLQGKATLNDTMINAVVGSSALLVLPGKGETPHSSDWMASQAMGAMLQLLKQDYHDRTVIFDLPPVLNSDDVISVLPRMDAALLVASSGVSTIEELQACKRYLEETPVVRVVVNNVPVSKIGESKY